MMLTAKEVQELYRISSATFARWTHRKGFPGIKIGSGSTSQWRVDSEKLWKWLEELR